MLTSDAVIKLLFTKHSGGANNPKILFSRRPEHVRFPEPISAQSFCDRSQFDFKVEISKKRFAPRARGFFIWIFFY